MLVYTILFFHHHGGEPRWGCLVSVFQLVSRPVLEKSPHRVTQRDFCFRSDLINLDKQSSEATSGVKKRSSRCAHDILFAPLNDLFSLCFPFLLFLIAFLDPIMLSKTIHHQQVYLPVHLPKFT